jgi:protein SCO1/2
MDTNDPRTRRKLLLLAALIGLAAGIMSAVLLLVIPSGPATQVATAGKALIGGPFSLVQADGTRVTDKTFAGKPMLVYFGFTNCPDVCPSGLQVISAALDKLGPKADGITPLFITVDPERDTPQVIGDYVKSFNPRIVGLSGSPEDVAAVTKAYRVYVNKVPNEKEPDRYGVDHSSFMYLMNSSGEFVKHFPHTVDADQLADEMAKVVNPAQALAN